MSSVMPRPSRSTNNSLSAGLPTEKSLPSTATSESPVSCTASSSWSPQLADSLTEAVVRAIGNSIPPIISSIQRNASSQASWVPGISASGAPLRVQVTVFLRWLQVRLPFPRLFLRLRQCRPLPSRARPAPWLLLPPLSYRPALLAVFQALSLRWHLPSLRRLLSLVWGMPEFLQNWCQKL